MAPSLPGVPKEFADAVGVIAAAPVPAAVELDELPAPHGLAPFAHALSGAVVEDGGATDLAGGRFVLLHRPGGHDEWRGAFRCVVLVEADLEPEIADDPLLAEVGWSWLMDSLADHGARFTAESGTVSRSSSHGFGGLSGRPATTAVEIRASWTPVAADPRSVVDLAAHLQAWCGLMMMCAGLPPEYEGVAALRPAGSSLR
jgi:hypothetical protein